jgi:hypothetical protein
MGLGWSVALAWAVGVVFSSMVRVRQKGYLFTIQYYFQSCTDSSQDW